MSTTYTQTFDRRSLQAYNDELTIALRQANTDTEGALVGTVIIGFLMGIGGLLVQGTLAAIAGGFVASYKEEVADMIYDALETLEEYEDLLQSGNFDLLELKLTCTKKRFVIDNVSQYFLIPTRITPIRIRSKSGEWIYTE